MSVPGESYEQWLARTAPHRPVRTNDPRTWGWGVIVLLGIFFLWVGGPGGWIGLGLVLVLTAEEIAQARMDSTRAAWHAHALRASTLLATLALSGLIIWREGGVAAALPVVLVLLDLKDDHSILRWASSRGRGR
jgi:hypothetical protein